MASFKDAALLTAAGAAIAGKLYLYHRYRKWRNSQQLENQPAWRNRRSFAKLPRRKQREIIYAKRASVRDLESISYGPGYQPRRRKA